MTGRAFKRHTRLGWQGKTARGVGTAAAARCGQSSYAFCTAPLSIGREGKSNG